MNNVGASKETDSFHHQDLIAGDSMTIPDMSTRALLPHTIDPTLDAPSADHHVLSDDLTHSQSSQSVMASSKRKSATTSHDPYPGPTPKRARRDPVHTSSPGVSQKGVGHRRTASGAGSQKDGTRRRPNQTRNFKPNAQATQLTSYSEQLPRRSKFSHLDAGHDAATTLKDPPCSLPHWPSGVPTTHVRDDVSLGKRSRKTAFEEDCGLGELYTSTTKKARTLGSPNQPPSIIPGCRDTCHQGRTRNHENPAELVFHQLIRLARGTSWTRRMDPVGRRKLGLRDMITPFGPWPHEYAHGHAGLHKFRARIPHRYPRNKFVLIRPRNHTPECFAVQPLPPFLVMIVSRNPRFAEFFFVHLWKYACDHL